MWILCVLPILGILIGLYCTKLFFWIYTLCIIGWYLNIQLANRGCHYSEGFLWGSGVLGVFLMWGIYLFSYVHIDKSINLTWLLR